MSHLLRRLKLSLLRRNLITSTCSRCFSSCPPIYYVRGGETWGAVSSEKISIPSLKVPMESLKEIGIIGASHGWVATLKNGVEVCLQDGPVHDPKRIIPLPPFVTLPHCQTQIVTNVAMSSSSPDDDDCIVAVKFLGPQLSLCRPAADKDCSKWSNIRITDPSFFSSHVMYSKRDDMFSMPASRGHYIGSWDLGRHVKEPKIQMLRLPSIPEMTEKEWERLESCCTKQHYLVESLHTDETFMVKWYRESRPIARTKPRLWEHFLVLKIDKEGNAVYTKDIGPLCIFLSKSEAFCIPSKTNLITRVRNSVYMLTDHEFAIVMIDSNQKFPSSPFGSRLPYYIISKED